VGGGGVEEISPNMFKTSFPSRSELQRMIEWGAMQTKDRKVVMVIEEGAGGSIFKQALRRVWVQMTSLPEELQDFPTIWAIGNILEVTKDVDMKFTRNFDRPRFQVLVLDPALILHSVDVVIGDYIYELHFKVEPENSQDNIEPLNMDDTKGKDGEDEGKEDMNGAHKMQIEQPTHEPRGGDSNNKINKQSNHTDMQGGKRVYHIPLPDLAETASESPVPEAEEELEDGDVEYPAVLIREEPDVVMHLSDNSNRTSHDRAEKLATIPEASTPSRRSKRRVDSTDQASLDRAEKLKAACNLDTLSKQGTNDIPTSPFCILVGTKFMRI
jgi:hypothetical protein